MAREESTQPSPGRVTGCRSRLERFSARLFLVVCFAIHFSQAGRAHSHPGRDGSGIAASPPSPPPPAAAGAQSLWLPANSKPAAAGRGSGVRAQQVSATVLTMLLRVPITTEMLPLSS